MSNRLGNIQQSNAFTLLAIFLLLTFLIWLAFQVEPPELSNTTSNYLLAVILAQYKMRELQIDELAPGRYSGTFESGTFEGEYTWELNITPYSPPNKVGLVLKRAIMKVIWQDSGASHHAAVVDYYSNE